MCSCKSTTSIRARHKGDGQECPSYRIGGRSQQDIDVRRKTNVTLYTADEGKALADVMTQVNDTYHIELRQRTARRKGAGEDGSFVRAGCPRAVLNIGSFPYADPQNHREGDVAERVDFENVRMAAQA